MITPVRIGGLILHLSNLCYCRELADGRLFLYMSCGSLHLEGKEAQMLREYLRRHSADLEPLYTKAKTEAQLPPVGKSVHERTTLLIPPNRGQ